MHAFLPCRKGSERIPFKNTKDFAGIKGGLLDIKIKQLMKVSQFESIVISSNDEVVLEYANQFKDSRLVIDERPDYLGSSKTSTDELIEYVPKIIPYGDVLWTHVTSPFLDEFKYEKIIKEYYSKVAEGHDSLMTVKRLRGFIWNRNNPVNYDRSIEKWPRTQTIDALFEVDSAVFINSISNYKLHNDRIGLRPSMFIQEGDSSIDIDWPEDFLYAEQLWYKKNRDIEFKK